MSGGSRRLAPSRPGLREGAVTLPACGYAGRHAGIHTVWKHFLESRTFLASGTVHAPVCHAGLGQDVSSADEIGIALVIAGDTSKRLSHARPISCRFMAVANSSDGRQARRSIGRASSAIAGRLDQLVTGDSRAPLSDSALSPSPTEKGRETKIIWVWPCWAPQRLCSIG
jgi:hypothetical protein